VKAPVPPSESSRLRALRRYDILDTLPEEAFDRITALATKILRAPMALVTFIDGDRQWFKSTRGIDGLETSRDVAFCAHAIMEDEALVVNDAREDPRFSDNPHVLGEPHVRFYAGAPLRTPDGHKLGSLCVIDTRPRTPSPEDRALLESLAAIVMDELELRRTTQTLEKQAHAVDAALQEAERNRHLFERIAHTSPEVIYLLDLASRQNVYANRNAGAQLGYTPEEIAALGDNLLPTILHPDDLPAVLAHFSEFDSMTDDDNTEITYRVRGVDGDYRWFRAHENVFSRHRDGRPKEILGIAADISELKRIETRLAELATTDELTGIANQRGFRERLNQLVAEGERGRAFALCIVDADHFKRINDTLGHPVGDQALATMARVLAKSIRRVDHVARYGGEEFSVLFVDVDEATAAILAERMRRAVEAIAEPVHLTASFGVAAYRRGNSVADLLKAADRALYAAKQQGRNRVVAAGSVD
jgi:diguanylate cyclase (GGDEF)-like protein/PAS domain S-box-containing protein